MAAIDKKRPIADDGIGRYLTHYLDAHRIRSMSKDTIKRHESALRRFIAWCDDRGVDDPTLVTRPMLERYQRYLYYYRKANGEPLSSGSQNVILAPVKSFFKWLTRENYLPYNPASEIILPKKPKRLPRHILSLEEIENVLSQPDINSAQGLRDRAMLELLYATGLRRIEIVTLEESSLDYQRNTLMVREGKGAKDRYVPLSERARHWLDRYCENARSELQIDLQWRALFLSDHGKPFSRGSLGAKVKNYLQQAGITATGSCHLFRHAMATHMLENGADIRYIQAMLGHDDLNSTEIYTRVSIEKLQSIHQATHPLASKS